MIASHPRLNTHLHFASLPCYHGSYRIIFLSEINCTSNRTFQMWNFWIGDRDFGPNFVNPIIYYSILICVFTVFMLKFVFTNYSATTLVLHLWVPRFWPEASHLLQYLKDFVKLHNSRERFSSCGCKLSKPPHSQGKKKRFACSLSAAPLRCWISMFLHKYMLHSICIQLSLECSVCHILDKRNLTNPTSTTTLSE